MVDFELSIFRREPLPHEIDVAQKEIDRQELAISMIERRIHKLLGDIQELRKAQIEHAQTARRCKGVITLARRVPEELLAKIFEHCVVDGWSRAPVVLSHVCSAWRKAALSPRVWSHLYVNTESAEVLGRTRYWLSMARQAPLHLTVMASWRTVHTQLSGAMAMLRKRASQWQTLNVSSDMLRHADHIIASCPPSMPNLREITIVTEVHFDPDLDGEQEILRLRNAFDRQRAPFLAEVRLTSNIIPNNFTVPSHITTLDICLKESPSTRPLSASSLLGVLETLPALKDLTLTLPLFYEHPYLEEEDLERTVTLSELTALTMYGPTNLNGFLAHLRTPALRRLHLRSLEDVGYRQEPIGPTLLNLITSSAPPLELLELHDVDLSPDYFAACFSAIPELHSLRLHESSISDATLRLLEPRPNGSALCLRLTHLDLRWCGQLTGRALVSLVSSRLKVNQFGAANRAMPIAEVAVLNCCYVQENDVLDLARMTICRVCLRDDDYCRSCKCCDNVRYRQRLRLRHMETLTKEERAQLKLIV